MTSIDPPGLVDDLVLGLKRLRQGRGVGAGMAAKRLTEPLRTLLGVHDDDTAEAAQVKAMNRLRAAVTDLPDNHRAVVEAAFGLTTNQRFYKDRISDLADRRNVVLKTVRRWVDDALPVLARALATGAPPPAPTWWTEDLRVAVTLDGRVPSVLEQRRIVAGQDGLSELDLAMTVTGADARTLDEGVSFEVFYGGTLRGRTMESADRIGLTLELPRPLARGDTHDYAVLVRLSSAEDLNNHYVCIPRYRCAAFDLRVRFARDRLPTRVVQLAEVYPRDVEYPRVRTSPVAVDGAGEVRTSFSALAVNQAFGLRWEY